MTDGDRPAMLRLFVDNLLPVFLAAGAGYLIASRARLDARTVSHVAFHVLAPCFVFRIIVDSRVESAAIGRMVLFAFVALTLPAAASALAGLALGWPRRRIAALVLVTLLPNAGNYGLSVSRFAFGEPGLAHAGLFFVAGSILTFTVGVLVASLGRMPVRVALGNLARVPAVWSVALAVAVVRAGLPLPVPVERTVGLFADACIPVFLIVLGMQLRGYGLRGPWGPVAAGTAMRLLGGVAAGLLLAPAIGLEGVGRQAGVLQSAMPSAVICTILATQYDVEPSLVTSVVLVTTLLSPLTLTPLLAWLGA